MYSRFTILFLLVFMLGGVLLLEETVAQETIVPQGGCVALDKTRPPLFISFERTDDKAWDGDKYVRGVLLRLNNNSNCVISLTAPPGYPREVPPTFGFKDGKYVRLPDVRIGSIESGSKVTLYYFTKYPGDESLYLDADFHVRDTISLNIGYHIFFSVPLKNFKRGGHVVVPFNYDWDSGIAPSFIVNENGMKRGFLAVKHYLLFEADQLPKDILR